MLYIVYKKNEKDMHDIKVEEDIRQIIKDYAEKMKTIGLAMESKNVIDELIQEMINLITKKEEDSPSLGLGG